MTSLLQCSRKKLEEKKLLAKERSEEKVNGMEGHKKNKKKKGVWKRLELKKLPPFKVVNCDFFS
jgi:hypothetical protein